LLLSVLASGGGRLAGPMPLVFYPAITFWGAQYQSVQEIKFKKIRLSLTLLFEWVGISGIDSLGDPQEIGDYDGVITFKFPNEIKAKIKNFTVTL
jgi:hypothetical protein